MDESLSGAEIRRRVGRSLRGSWQEVVASAEEMYGERGRMLAILQQPVAMQWSKSNCENLLRAAGFNNVNRILEITNQSPTLKGLKTAIQRVRELLEQDVCPAYLKSGRCECESCVLRHHIEH